MKISMLCCTISLGLTAFTKAGPAAEMSVETPPFALGWEFRASLYGWLTGLDGSTGVGGLVAEPDVGFVDILDDVKMAAALQLEARNGKWGILADGFYVDLGTSAPTPGMIYDRVGIDMKEFIGELSVAYRVYDSSSAFIDLYAGVRYNNLSMRFEGDHDAAGIQTISDNASDRVAEGVGQRAEELAQSLAASYQSASAVARAKIENRIISGIESQADGRVKRDLAVQLLKIRREGGLDVRDVVSAKINIAVKKQRLQLARATARLEVAKLRATVDESLQAAVTQARSKAQRAEENLAAALDRQFTNAAPTTVSAEKDWLDPILGARLQWNIYDRLFIAGKTDIGGFGLGSDLAWTLQATVGYNFTKSVSAELGYRYLHTDYNDGAFTYDMTQAGVFTCLNLRF